MAITYVGQGAGVTANAGNLTPALPTGLAAGDLILAHGMQHTTGITIPTPSGYTQLFHVEVAEILHILFGKVAGASESAPTIDFSDTANLAVAAQCSAFRGWSGALVDLSFGTRATQPNELDDTTAGPIPGIAIANGDAVVVMVGRDDDWTSVNTLSGDGLTWAEIGDPDTSSGADAGLVWDYAINGSGSGMTIADKTFTIVGGTVARWTGVMLKIPLVSAAVPFSGWGIPIS